MSSASDDLLATAGAVKFGTILADPPWQFQNRTGKMAPEHKRLSRYPTMTLDAICDLPVEAVADARAHLYLWVPNALLPEGLKVMEHWGFKYKSNLIWYKVRKDGGPDRRGVGFARGPRKNWTVWGNQADDYQPDWPTYSNHSQSNVVKLR